MARQRAQSVLAVLLLVLSACVLQSGAFRSLFSPEHPLETCLTRRYKSMDAGRAAIP